MFKIIAVTNRKLCEGDFLKQIEKVASENVSAIILREKDLQEEEYRKLSESVISVCDRYSIRCILHTYLKTAEALGQSAIHLPLPVLRENRENVKAFQTVGVSVHSAKEAMEAQELGATYVTAGHVFATDCKKGVPPRGIAFLKEVVKSVEIPVFAIGGVNADNIEAIKQTGAAGCCIMSGFMRK